MAVSQIVLEAVQSVQELPPVPHAPSWSPVWQVPPLQQPLLQELGPQLDPEMQVPATISQVCPITVQSVQAPPPLPQAVSIRAVTHWPLKQHVRQVPGPQPVPP